MGKLNRSSEVSRDQAMIAGVKKHFKGVTLTIAGKTFTDVQIVNDLQAGIDTAIASSTAKAVWQAAVKADKTQQSTSKGFKLDLRQLVLAMFSAQPDTLVDFGLAPRKTRPKLKADKLVLKAARSKATRTARHTVGPKTRKAIKGSISSVEIVSTDSSSVQQTNGSSSMAPKP